MGRKSAAIPNSRLRELRLGMGLSREALAERVGVSADIVKGWETGRVRRPHPANMGALAKVLEVEINDLGFGLPNSTDFTAAKNKRPVEGNTAVLYQLPPDISDFTGREESVSELTELLTDRGANINAVTVAALSGKGGIGKTTLALHIAHKVRERFPDGQLYVDLRGSEADSADPAEVLGRFLNELGLDAGSIPDRLEDRARLYRTHLAKRKILVVLDNAGDERQVHPLIPGNPECAVLVASRKRLLGLSGAHHVQVETMTPDQGRNLLISILGYARVSAEEAAARDIIKLCSQLPLALRIAGVRLVSRPQESLAAFAKRLRNEQQRLDLLKAGDLEVRASFALSYEGCTTELKRAFRLLGMLGSVDFAPWTLALLDSISIEHAEDLLEQLVDVELLEIAADDPIGGRRYRFHDLLRVFARERLKEMETEEERRSSLENLLKEYVRFGANAAALLEPGGLEQGEEALEPVLQSLKENPGAWFKAERPAFVAGVSLAFESEHWELCWRIAELLPVLFRWQSDWSDWEKTHKIGVEAAQRGSSAKGEARIRRSLALLYRAKGQYAAANRELERSAQIFEELGDDLHKAVVDRQKGDTCRYTGLLTEGIEHFSSALPVFREHGAARMEAGTLNGLGDIYRGLSKWEESSECFQQSIALYESLRDPLEIARAKVRFGLVYRDQCLYNEAERLYLEGLATIHQAGDRRWEARTLRHLGVARRNAGRVSAALEQLGQAVNIFKELADHRGTAVTVRNIGDAYRYSDNFDKSSEYLTEALERFRALNDMRWEARSLVSFADTLCRNEDWDQATEYLETALNIFRDIEDNPGKARVLRSFGILYRGQKNWTASLDTFRKSHKIFETLGDHIWVSRVIAGEAITKELQGDATWITRRREAEKICRDHGARSHDETSLWLHEW